MVAANPEWLCFSFASFASVASFAAKIRLQTCR